MQEPVVRPGNLSTLLGYAYRPEEPWLIPCHMQVDSSESLENVESKWVGEILENCPGVELVLVALKCDLRPSAGGEEERSETEPEPKKQTLTYKQGLEVAKRIQALRYLGMSLSSSRFAA